MTKLELSVLAGAAFVFGCSDPSGRPTDSEDSTSLTTVGTEDGQDETGDSSGNTNTNTDNGDGDGDGDEGGPKYDLAPIPDGPQGCGGGDQMSAFSYIWIANSTQGTVSKIDTVSTIEEGRYFVTPDPSIQPSRTSVNQYGDVAIGHRFFPRVTKVAARIENCVDRNQNGMIETSSGPNDVLPYFEDECVLWTADLPANANGTRAVAWEGGSVDPDTCENTIPNPRLWVAYAGSPVQVYRLDGDDGSVLDHAEMPTGGFAYGGAVNAEGDFWVSDRVGGALGRIDGETLAVDVWGVPGSQAYGIGMDENGHPWFATYTVGVGDYVYRFDPDIQQFYSAGGVSGRYRGLTVDREGRVWVAGNSPCRLAQFDAATETEVNDAIALPGCVDPVGTSVDRDGYVWVVDRGAGLAWKVDPVFHLIVGMVVGLENPYTYSDMTGQGLNLVVNPPG